MHIHEIKVTDDYADRPAIIRRATRDPRECALIVSARHPYSCANNAHITIYKQRDDILH